MESQQEAATSTPSAQSPSRLIRNFVVFGVVVLFASYNLLLPLARISNGLREPTFYSNATQQLRQTTDSGFGQTVHSSDDNVTASSNNVKHALSSKSNLDYCIKNRGTRGNWYYNATMARKTFYANGFRSNKWHRQNQNNQTAVYPGNSYAWNDTTAFEEQKCRPILPVTKETFCNTMERLNIQRLFFVGDSLASSHLTSLLSLMGYNACDFIKCSKKAVIKKNSIECPSNSPGISFSIPVIFSRENLGANLRLTDVDGREDATRGHRQQFGPEIPYCVDELKTTKVMPSSDGNYYCPWHHLYNSTRVKTLLILNQGAHFHSVETFSDSMDQFVQSFNAIGHQGDIVVFRNTVPGHADCFEARNVSVPLSEMTHEKFMELYSTTKYDWNLFDEYNRVARRSFDGIKNDITAHYLNVYNMTVLRSDQHIAADDCLHYMHPGPVDFWNHLLFTNLADIADNLDESHV